MKRALVTGATGFVGGRLVRRLAAEGWAVTALRRSASAPLRLPGVRARTDPGDAGGLARLIREARPDVVFHLASLFIAEHSPEDVARLVESNLLFGCRLAEAMAAAGCRRLVNTGTSWEHFGPRGDEPANLYAATKRAFEELLEYYRSAERIEIVTLELFDTYGPGDERPKLMVALRRALVQDVAFSPGLQRINLVHVDDVVTAYLAAARRLLAGKVHSSEIYSVRGPRAATLREVAEAFSRAAGRPLRIRWGARPYRVREIFRPWSRGRILPGWRPRVDLDEGLRRLLAEP